MPSGVFAWAIIMAWPSRNFRRSSPSGGVMLLYLSPQRLRISANPTVLNSKPPEPYKGKGIRYEGEVVKHKEGKAGKGKK